MTWRRPPALQAGDVIGIIAPSSPFDVPRMMQGVAWLEGQGFRVRYRADLFEKEGYLAGRDRRRLKELDRMVRDPEVKAILAARGGYGTMRLLEHVNYEAIRQYPKIWLGFSDLTALHAAIERHAGLITFHAPMACSLTETPSTIKTRYLNGLQNPHAMGNPFESSGIGMRRGVAEGRLLPANLTMLAHLIGTDYFPRMKGRILLVEDVNEEPYRIDRMVTHLHLAGAFKGVTGLALGCFTPPGSSSSATSYELPQAIQKRFLDMAALYKIPLIAHLPFGHIPENHLVPRGVKARIDGQKGTLEILESAVRRV